MGTTNPATRAMDSLHAATVVYSIAPVHQAILTDHCSGMISGKDAIANPKRVTHCIHLIENIAMQLIVQPCVNLHFFHEITSCIFAEKVPFIYCYYLKMSALFIIIDEFVSSQL